MSTDGGFSIARFVFWSGSIPTIVNHLNVGDEPPKLTAKFWLENEGTRNDVVENHISRPHKSTHPFIASVCHFMLRKRRPEAMTFLLNLKYTYLYTYLIFINILIYTGFPKVLGDSWYSVNCFFGSWDESNTVDSFRDF